MERVSSLMDATMDASGGSEEEQGSSQILRDYRELNARIRKAGLYETRDSYYLGKYAVVIALLVAAWLVVAQIPWLGGILFGLVIQQSAFIAHDLGHNSVMTRTRGWLFNRQYKNVGVWSLGNVCFGIDGVKWSENHSVHHRVNLLYGKDPQNSHLPWLLYQEGELDHFHEEGGRIDGFHCWWLRHQHLFALPFILLIQKLNMLRKTPRLLRSGGYVAFLGIVIHVSAWVALFLRSNFSPTFLLIAMLTGGIIHVQILLSHAYMPRFTEADQRRVGWIRYQILGTQNVDTTWYDGWFHGGLQYQIEHHLFQAVPRHNLPKIQPWVKEFCEKHGLPYQSDPFRVCIADMLRSFYRESRNVEVRV